MKFKTRRKRTPPYFSREPLLAFYYFHALVLHLLNWREHYY
jgi:hypothetical protein